MKQSFPARIYLIALFVRLVPVLLAKDLGIGLDDMFQYDMLARSIASGNGFRWYAHDDLKLLEPYVKFDLDTVEGYDPAHGIYTSFRAPLYPAFLAIIYYISGGGPGRFFSVRLVQAVLLGAPLSPLTFFVSGRLFPGRMDVAKASASIVAIYPMLLLYPLGLATENLFFLLLLVSFFHLLKPVNQATAGDAVLAGLFLGMTALTRSVVLPFALSAIIFLAMHNWKTGSVAGTVFLCVIGPWIIRNSVLHQRFTGIESSLGYNLYVGYHPDGNGSFMFGPSLDLLPIMDDSVRDRTGTQKALDFIRTKPARFLPLALNRLGFFFGLEKRVLMYFYSNDVLGYIPRPILLTVSFFILAPFVVLCILSAFSLPCLEREHGVALLGILMISYLIPHIFILSEERFHLALIPFFSILSVLGWACLANTPSRGTASRRVVFVSATLVFCLLANWGFELHRDAAEISVILGPKGNVAHFPY